MNLLNKIYITLRAQGRHPLNRKSSLRAAWDFSVAQVAARLVPGDVCVDFPNETKLLVSPQMKGAAHFIYPGLCEFEDMAFILHFLMPDDWFVDVGANVGAFTVLAAGVVRSRAIAFEPNPTTFRSLALNVRLNGLEGRVTALNLALGREEGSLQMTEGLGTENRVCVASQETRIVTVKTTTLDRALATINPLLIKLDVEGFESEVFAGGAETLRNPHLQAMIVEMNGAGNRYGFDENALHQKIRDHGFKPCAYAPFKRELIQQSAATEGNIIYVRDMESARKRLRASPPFRFKGLTI